MKIEVEGKEIAIQNESGDIVIIPKDKRELMLNKLQNGKHSEIDKYIQTLPQLKDYAEDGTVIPGDPPSKKKPVIMEDIGNDTLVAPELDEVVIKDAAKPTVGRFFKMWGDNIPASDNFMGALGQGIGAALSLPQAAATYIASDGRETQPSKALKGTKFDQVMDAASNLPGGAGIVGSVLGSELGQDVVLDPLNIPIAKGVKAVLGGERIAGEVLEHGDDVVKNLPKLEQIPLDFRIEDFLKNISSTERKNMEIVKKGNAYFRELDNPESLKRLKEFGDEYSIDLLDAYKKAEKRWDYGNNIGKNDRFQVAGEEVFKDDIESALGVSTFDNKGMMKGFLSKDKFADKSLENHSINYVNKKASIEDYNTIVWHELSHDINKHIISQSTKLQKDLSDIFVKNIDEVDKTKIEAAYRSQKFDTYEKGLVKTKKENMSIEDIAKDELAYVSKPTETWAFLSTNLRQDLKNTGVIKNYNEILTPEKLEQAIKNGNTVFSRFEPYIKDKDAFIKLFNKMTLSIAPAALYLQSQNQNKTEQ